MGRPSTRLLSRELIATEALRLYEEVGAAGFSLRRLAARMNVKSPSFYNHVSGQDDLVAAMQEQLQVHVDMDCLDDPDWRVGIGTHARSYRASFLRHPEVALMICRLPMNDLGMELYGRQLRAFRRYGLSERDALMLSASVDYLVFGSLAIPYVAGVEPAELGLDGDGASDPDEAAGELRGPNDAGFEWGLQALLDRVGALVG